MTLEDSRTAGPSSGDAAGQADTATRTLRLRTGLYLLPQGDDAVFVRDGSRAAFSKIVRDPAGRRLLTRMVQASTTPTTCGDLAALLDADAAVVAEIAEQLLDSGVLESVEDPLRTTSVLVVGEGHLRDSLLGLAATEPRLAVETVDGSAGLTDRLMNGEELPDIVAVATDALDPALNLDVNVVALEHQLPIVYAHIDGREAVMGPLVVPGETACYLCHDVQDEGARHLRDEYIVYKDSLRRGVAGPTADPAVAALAAAWLRLALVKHDRRVRGFLDQRVLRIETSRMEVMTHRVLVIPRCPACAPSRADLEHTFA